MGEIPQKSGPIRVLLADDHTMFRQGLVSILPSYSGMEVMAEVPNDADALELARDLFPDVVIMQVQMPFSRAIETLKAMRAFARPPKVIIFESPRYIRALTGVGASAYVLKTSSAEHLVAAVRAAASDPASESVVVGMPLEMLEGTREGACLEASSGEVVRHRLSLAGNRKLDYALHMVAVCQTRSDARGGSYYRKKMAEGKSRKEALRCLKRRVSDAVFRSLLSASRGMRKAPLDKEEPRMTLPRTLG